MKSISKRLYTKRSVIKEHATKVLDKIQSEMDSSRDISSHLSKIKIACEKDSDCPISFQCNDKNTCIQMRSSVPV